MRPSNPYESPSTVETTSQFTGQGSYTCLFVRLAKPGGWMIGGVSAIGFLSMMMVRSLALERTPTFRWTDVGSLLALTLIAGFVAMVVGTLVLLVLGCGLGLAIDTAIHLNHRRKGSAEVHDE